MGDSSEILQPGQSIRPNVSSSRAQELVLQHFEFRVTRIKELVSYDDNNFFVEAVHTKTGAAGRFVFKVLNSMDSKKTSHVEAENEGMRFLHSKGVNCPVPMESVHGTTFPLVTIQATPDPDNNVETESTAHILRLLTFVEGKILHEVSMSQKLLFEMGSYIGEIENLLKDFSHPALTDHKTLWALSSAPQVRKFMDVLKGEPKKYDLITDVLDTFVRRVEPAYAQLQKGLIHGDFNEQNIIVKASPGNPAEHVIHGLIDFGDLNVTHYVFELGIMLCYMMLECVKTGEIDPMEGSGLALAGYMTQRNVPELELELLRTCIAARLSQSLVMGAYSYSKDPGNEYLLTTAKTGWGLLQRLWNETTDEQLISLWRNIISKSK